MHRVFKGALAGLAGGMAGAAAKLYAEKHFHAPAKDQAPSSLVLVERMVEVPFTQTTQDSAVQEVPWVFGGLIGALYGIAVEYHPKASAANGIAFGLLLNQLTHQGLLPGYGLTSKLPEQSSGEKQGEQTSYAIYGAVTELVRSLLRRGL